MVSRPSVPSWNFRPFSKVVVMRAPVMPRMPERDGPAVHVELGDVDAQVVMGLEDLGRERLVDLHQVDVPDRHPGPGHDASTGPRPMISGDNADTPEDTIRASGVMPSSAALTLLITMTAAAPSLSGQQFPAVTVRAERPA